MTQSMNLRTAWGHSRFETCSAQTPNPSEVCADLLRCKIVLFSLAEGFRSLEVLIMHLSQPLVTSLYVSHDVTCYLWPSGLTICLFEHV